jgi:uncharacterized protein (DUF1499 family)
VRFPAFALGTAAAALLLLAVAGPLYRVGVPLAAAFTLFQWGAYAGLLSALLAVAVAVLAFRRGARLQAAVAIAAIGVGLIAFGIPYQWQRRAQSAPPIHDISTDLENPPEFGAIVPLRANAPNALERTPEVTDHQRRAHPDLSPVTLTVQRDVAFERALAVAQASGWEIVLADKPIGRIEATDTTPWFGFKDDIAIRVMPWGSGSRVDVRSVSRVGVGDAGTNARRVSDFVEALAGTDE